MGLTLLIFGACGLPVLIVCGLILYLSYASVRLAIDRTDSALRQADRQSQRDLVVRNAGLEGEGGGVGKPIQNPKSKIQNPIAGMRYLVGRCENTSPSVTYALVALRFAVTGQAGKPLPAAEVHTGAALPPHAVWNFKMAVDPAAVAVKLQSLQGYPTDLAHLKLDHTTRMRAEAMLKGQRIKYERDLQPHPDAQQDPFANP
jgi:hypothetical protein